MRRLLGFATAILVGIVVLQTHVRIFGGHAGPFVLEAVVRVVGRAESIVITNAAKVYEVGFFVLNKRDVIRLSGGADGVDRERQFNARKHSAQADNFRLAASASINVEGGSCGFYYQRSYSRKADLIGWCKPIVLSDHSNALFVSHPKIFYLTGRGSHVGSQLSLFAVFHNADLGIAVVQLIQSRYQDSRSDGGVNADANDGNYFKNKFPPIAAGVLFVVFIVLFGKGYERLVYGGKLYGAAAMVLGWLTGLAAVWVIIAWFSGHPIWPLVSENVSAAPGIDASAPCYSSTENVRVLPIVVTELKLGNVKRHVLGADLVECADNAALNQRPKAIDCLSMNRTDNVLVLVMINSRVREFPEIVAIAGPRVGCEQADFVGNRFVHKFEYGLRVDAFQNFGDDFTLPADCADDLDLAGAWIAGAAAPLVPMFVLVLPADVGFVHLDDASELVRLVFAEASADTVAHIERGFVGAEAHDALNLQCADTLLAGQHHMDDPEPVAEGLIRVLEDRPYQNGEPIAARLGALAALPMEGPIGHGINVNIPASRAMDALGPATGDEVAFAIVIRGKHVVKLLNCKLFYRLCAGHVGLPQSVRATYAI